MEKHEWLVEQFEAHRIHLRAVAYRMLGSQSEADDAVQESWFRLNRSDTSDVENLGGWLTTVVSRVCLDMLRSRESRREESLDVWEIDPMESSEEWIDPEHEVLQADSVGMALLVVLDTLNPAERLAFVLHDVFGVPFDEIGPIVGRSPTAARQLASRARRRVQGANRALDADNTRKQEIVSAFLAASRGGDFQALLTLLDPEVVLHADSAAVLVGASEEVRGAEDVARQFSGRAKFAQLALLDGSVGAIWVLGGQTRVAFSFTIKDGKIVEINLFADSEKLRQLDPQVLDD
ncbi:MAG TPA: sigma-70 family RNA polymerase sigma factor [Ktedonobacteraceae bacterium]|nr:sigma-70 family RNA polymerase sigma factor [Ktedonobacteraceae bacterium]